MFSYESYKVLHFISLFLLIASYSVAYYATATKKSKIVVGLSTLFIFVSGMGLMARLGIKHAEGYPLWIILKMSFWLIVAASAAIIPKRFTQKKLLPYSFLFIFVLLAISVAVHKYT